MRTSKTPITYYICDRTACDVCVPECKHTSNIAHAKNFRAECNGETVKQQNAFGFFEREYENTGGSTAAVIPDKGGGR